MMANRYMTIARYEQDTEHLPTCHRCNGQYLLSVFVSLS